jgi:hypothetical protein
MKWEGFLGTLKFVAARLAIAEIVVFALTGVVCWLFGGRTLADYSTVLLLVGFLALVFGAVPVFGGNSLDRDYIHQYSKSVMPISASGRVQQNLDDMAQGMSFTFWAGSIGLITVLLGIGIKVLIYI